MVDLKRAKRKADKVKQEDKKSLLTKICLGVYLGGMLSYGIYLSRR
jgi:hypothetical protein